MRGRQRHTQRDADKGINVSEKGREDINVRERQTRGFLVGAS